MRGGVATIVGQGVRFVANLCGIAVLARLLRPEEFGLVAMVFALTGFLSRFKDLGLAVATVQRSGIDHRELTALFWLSSAIGLSLTLLVLASGPVLGWIYGDSRLVWIASAMSIFFVISGLGVQHAAILRRDLRFASLAAIEVVAVLVSTLIGIVAAVNGAGYWALVAVPVGNAATLTLGAWWTCGWRPDGPGRGADVRTMVAFGSRLSVVSLLNSLARSVDVFLVGWRWGAVPLGLYTKAVQLNLIFVEQLNIATARVAIPVLSSLQNDPERFRGYYRRGIQLVALIGVPIGVGLFVFAEDVVHLVLGPQWHEAVALVQYMAPAALFESLRATTSWVYISMGHSAKQLRWAALSTVVRLVGIGVGSSWGAEGVAIGYSLAVSILWAPGVVYCFGSTPIRLRDLIRVLWRPMVAAFLAGILSGWVLGPSASYGENVIVCAIGRVGFFGVIYLMASVLLPGGWAAFRDMATLVRELRPREAATLEILR